MAKRKVTQSEKLAVGYVRVSSSKQVESGLSLEAQREQIEAYAKLYGWKLVEIVEDAGYSAKDLDRPGVTKALDMVKTGKVGALIISKLDRLTRHFGHLGNLLDSHFDPKKGGALISVGEQFDSSTPGGLLVMGILSTVATWERVVIADRTSTAIQKMKAEGKCTGYAPFGKQVGPDGVYLVDCPEEQQILKTIADLKANGMSLRKIAVHLNNAGVLNRGHTWSFMAVDRVSANIQQQGKS